VAGPRAIFVVYVVLIAAGIALSLAIGIGHR
jgi:hypothetical protein